MSAKALAPGSLILVTGVNGYVGGHVADLLLSLGYKVRGTARDQAKIDLAAKAFDKKYPGLFEGAIISDFGSHDAFAHVVKGVDGVVHVASDVSFGYDPNEVVTNVVAGVKNVLTAANEEPRVKRFVYTSSNIAAIETIPEGTPEGVVVDQKSWNRADVEKAWAEPPYTPERALSVYAASKVSGEEAIWNFVKEKKPHFVLNTVLPGFVLGPKAFAGQNLSTSGWVQGLYAGDEQGIGMLLNFPPIWSVDARDVARVHVAGLLDTDVESQRILIVADSTNYSRFVAALEKADPSHGAYPAATNTALDKAAYDVELATKLVQRFGRPGLTHLDESVRDQLAAAAAN